MPGHPGDSNELSCVGSVGSTGWGWGSGAQKERQLVRVHYQALWMTRVEFHREIWKNGIKLMPQCYPNKGLGNWGIYMSTPFNHRLKAGCWEGDRGEGVHFSIFQCSHSQTKRCSWTWEDQQWRWLSSLKWLGLRDLGGVLQHLLHWHLHVRNRS